MIKLSELVDFCINKSWVTQEFPFGEKIMVFKVFGKMFLLTDVNEWQNGNERINIKNKPEKNISLRTDYASIIPGYHMNKKHWNTLEIFEGEISRDMIFSLIDESYDIVASKLSKKDKMSFL